jgi:hypothetical protein
MRCVLRLLLILLLAIPAWCASKPHIVAFGKVQSVRISLGPEESRQVSINVRPLYVDTKLKEFTTGSLHEVTDRLFVVQRAFRINDGLPVDKPKQPKWLWQRGGWLLVDRTSGHITQLKFPDFDPAYSEVSWYRDYAAYCGISEGADRWNALVAQVGARKAVYRKELGRSGPEPAESGCGLPHWERHPARVTFKPSSGEEFTVNVATRQTYEPVDTPAEQ